jgi:hypothetical protein
MLAASLVPQAGCALAPADAGAPEVDSTELVGAPEGATGTSEDAILGSVPVGTPLVATANLNLRNGSSTSATILTVIPYGGKVLVREATPQHGFYKVTYGATVGWSYGYYLKKAPTSGGTSSDRDGAISRARASVGFSYWWGHGRFLAGGPGGNPGTCDGSCPGCTHGGSYGGDCSGLAAKVWQVPSSNDTLSVDAHPYSTWDFDSDSSLWSGTSRSTMKRADAMVYNTSGHGHIFVYDTGDSWGWMHAYECKGCSYGCVYGSRTASGAYRAIRRAGY